MAELFGDKVAATWEETGKYVETEFKSQPSPPELREKLTIDHVETVA